MRDIQKLMLLVDTNNSVLQRAKGSHKLTKNPFTNFVKAYKNYKNSL